MWICDVCGMELDDALESCPFGCGPKKAKEINNPHVERFDEKEAVLAVEDKPAEPKLVEATGSCTTSMRSPDGDVIPEEVAKPEIKKDSNDAVQMSSRLVLTEGRTGARIDIDSLACVLGREGDYKPEIFSQQVSRLHMEIRQSGGIWKGSHIGLNPSVLVTSNGRINMEDGIDYPLHDGDRLRMANQIFLVNIEEMEEHEVNEGENTDAASCFDCENTDANTDDLLECWCVICPKCGAKYQVENGDSQVSECQKCTDSMDRREIRRITPTFGSFVKEELIDAR